MKLCRCFRIWSKLELDLHAIDDDCLSGLGDFPCRWYDTDLPGRCCVPEPGTDTSLRAPLELSSVHIRRTARHGHSRIQILADCVREEPCRCDDFDLTAIDR